MTPPPPSGSLITGLAQHTSSRVRVESCSSPLSYFLSDVLLLLSEASHSPFGMQGPRCWLFFLLAPIKNKINSICAPERKKMSKYYPFIECRSFIFCEFGGGGEINEGGVENLWMKCAAIKNSIYSKRHL